VVFLLTISKRHRHHVTQVRTVLVDGHTVVLTRVVRVEDVVGILSGSETGGYAAEGKCERGNVGVGRGFGGSSGACAIGAVVVRIKCCDCGQDCG
jgi:hypothetical protein